MISIKSKETRVVANTYRYSSGKLANLYILVCIAVAELQIKFPLEYLQE